MAEMQDFEVTVEVILHVPVKIRQPAPDKETALTLAVERFPLNASDALIDNNGGWRASVDFKAPRGVVLKDKTAQATVIVHAPGTEKVRPIPKVVC